MNTASPPLKTKVRLQQHRSASTSLRNVIAILLMLFTVPATIAADVGLLGDKRVGDYELRGELVLGDAEKLVKHLLANASVRLGVNGEPRHVRRLYVSSVGGSVGEAMRIAQLVEALHIQIEVAPKGVCSSACFLMFASANRRYAIGADDLDNRFAKGTKRAGIVGLHRPFLKRSDPTFEPERQHAAMTAVREFLEQRQVPRRLVDEMMSRSSKDIHWMTDEDLALLSSYSPAYEELIIDRCGMSPNLHRRAIDDALKANDKVTASRLFEEEHKHEERIFDCMQSVDEIVWRTRGAPALQRMREGWRPW